MKKEKIFKWLKRTWIAILVLTVVSFWIMFTYIMTIDTDGEYYTENYECEEGNVAIVKMYGPIDLIEDGDYMSVQSIVEQIEMYSDDKNIDTIILEVYSPGGIASAGEMVMNALKRSPKKTVALALEEAGSAAYLAMLGADKIYATTYTSVGSIGATFSYLDFTEKNAKDGIRFQSISAGEFKDMFNTDKPLTAKEKAKLMELLDDTHEIFINTVAERRGLPVEEVRKLADGSMYTTKQALENGLIDAVGDVYDILEDLSDEGEEATLCKLGAD